MERSIFAALFGISAAVVSAQFPGGSGTLLDPYQVAAKGDLKTLSEDTLLWTRHFVQTADIVFSAADFDSGGAFFNAGKGFLPIGSERVVPGRPQGKFSGSYDGGDHVISGLRMRREDFMYGTGLFGTLDTGATVRNLKLEEVDVTGSSKVGGLAGTNRGRIANVSVSGKVTGVQAVTGTGSIGGLVGENHRSIEDCRAAVTVKCAAGNAGGLVGSDGGATVRSSASGDVSGTHNLGGLAGTSNGEIIACSATGQVDGERVLGGLIGSLARNGFSPYTSRKGYVAHSSASGKVTGKYQVGGLLGHNHGEVDSSFASGPVSADSLLGGLVGVNAGVLLDDFAIGPVAGRRQAGGLVGRNDSVIISCSARGDVKGGDAAGGLVGNSSYRSSIRNSAAYGSVVGVAGVGGLVGAVAGTSPAKAIVGSRASGNVRGYIHVGGLLGRSDGAVVEDSYATGTVIADLYAGGLAGSLHGELRNCFSAGPVLTKRNGGGLMTAYSNRTVENCYWDLEESGWTTSEGGTGKSTAQMKTASTFTDSGWDFAGTWTLDATFNSGYPSLRWEKKPVKPDVQTLHVHVIRSSSFTVSGRLAGLGSGRVKAYGFVWNTTGKPERGRDSEKDFGGTDATRSFSFDLAGLGARTRYFVRAFAVNDSGIAYGAELSEETVPYGGSGTEREPYLIADLAALKYLGESDPWGNWPKHYALSRDLAFSAADFAVGGLFHNGGAGFVPLGLREPFGFQGVFDGAGHAITGLKIHRPDTINQGFVGYSNNAHIKNLRLLDVQISGREYVGGVIGVSFSSTVSGCVVTGAVTGTLRVGGLVGHHGGGGIYRSSSRAAVQGTASAGSLVGSAENDTLEDSYASGTVSGGTQLGGLVGLLSGSDSRIARCFATGNVQGKRSLGGLAGEVRFGHLRDVYARGAVQGDTMVGGLAGANKGSIHRAYATGKVTGKIKFGGLIGSDSGNVRNSFWDVQASDEDLSNGGAGRTTAQMKSAETYTRKDGQDLTEAWDFAGSLNDDAGSEDTWALSAGANDGYPYLKAIGIPEPLALRPPPARPEAGTLQVTRIGRYGMVVTTETAEVLRLSLLDVSGRTVTVLTASNSTGRIHSFAWNLGGATPVLAQGRYLAEIRTSGDRGPVTSKTVPFTLP